VVRFGPLIPHKTYITDPTAAALLFAAADKEELRARSFC
jgi:hypothetical protein